MNWIEKEECRTEFNFKIVLFAAITRVGGNKKGIFTRERQPKGAATHVRKRYIRLAQEIDNFKFNEELEPYSAPFVSHFRKNRVEL